MSDIPARPSFQTLRDAGFECLPGIPPGARLSPMSKLDPSNLGKIPGKYSFAHKDWRGLKKWSDYEYQSDGADVRSWDQIPEANVCIRTGKLLVIDIDCNDAAVVRSLCAALGLTLGCAPIRRRSNSERYALLYLLAPGQEPFSKSAIEFVLADGGKTELVEFLSAGTQFVAYGTHPSGGRYFWSDDLIALEASNSIPRVTAADFDEALKAVKMTIAEFGGTIGKAGRRRTSSSAKRLPIPSAEHLAPGFVIEHEYDVMLDVEQQPEPFRVVADALNAIDNRDRQRNGFDRDGEPGYIEIIRSAKAATGGSETFLELVVIPWALTYTGSRGEGLNTDDSVRNDWHGFRNSTLGWDFPAAQAEKTGKWSNPYRGETFDQIHEEQTTADDPHPETQADDDRASSGQLGELTARQSKNDPSRPPKSLRSAAGFWRSV